MWSNLNRFRIGALALLVVAIGVLGGVSGSPIADAAHSEPVAIVLDPAGAIEVTVGDLQTLTATVTDIDGLPVEGVGVEFTTFGFDVLGNETTSAAGIAEISFTRLVPGEDIVRAEFELDSFPVSSDDLVITWVAAAPPPGPSGPVDIELDPAGAIEVVVGTLQTLTATVTDIDGLPVEGVGVEFTTFGFGVLGNETTSAAGTAEISFTRLVPGEDIVRAEFELDTFPVSSDDLIITWVAAAPPPGPSGPVDIELDPAGAIEVVVGTLQTLTATVTDIDGLPVEGVGVEFTTFGFDVLGNETTSAAGIAEISFTRSVSD